MSSTQFIGKPSKQLGKLQSHILHYKSGESVLAKRRWLIYNDPVEECHRKLQLKLLRE